MDTPLARAVQALVRDLRTLEGVTLTLHGDLVEVQQAGGPPAPLDHATGASEEQLKAHIADRLQDYVVDALWTAGFPTSWPPCPDHPDSHPLRAVVLDEVAVWSCPKGAYRRTIGGLDG